MAGLRVVEDVTEERWVPGHELGQALHLAHEYLARRSLVNAKALELFAALKLARERGESQVPIAERIRDYLSRLEKRPEALLRQVQDGLKAQRDAEQRAARCGDCGAAFPMEKVATAAACPACGAPRRPAAV